jgi:hypothetical protein
MAFPLRSVHPWREDKEQTMTATSLGASASPGQPELRYLCAIRADLGPALEFETSNGSVRAMFPIIGGEIGGSGLTGRILPGGADFAQRLPDGAYAIEARYCLMLDDGTPLMITNAGRMQPMPGGSYQGRTRAVIEAPAGAHGWLSDAVLFGTVWAEPGDEVRVFIELWYAVL